MKHTRTLAVAASLAAAALVLSGCSGSDSGGGDDTLRLWHYEGADSAMGIAWDEAIKVFEEETGATVEFEEKSFEQIRSTASQVLNSDEAPDILEYNKGNATAGLLSSQGLLTPLDDAVEEYGWDEQLAPSLQTTAKYDENGIMGSGNWYGVPNYGEFVEVYYNKDVFAAAGLEVPTTLAEFEDVLAAFADTGRHAARRVRRGVPARPALVPARAHEGRPRVRRRLPALRERRSTVGRRDHVRHRDRPGLDRQGLHLDRLQRPQGRGRGRRLHQRRLPDLLLGQLVVRPLHRPRSTTSSGARSSSPRPSCPRAPRATCGSSPRSAKNKELAYEFIDITMRPEIQALLGNNGGVPVAADPADITDEKSKELIANFNALTEQDGLAFYPDWPTPTFYDELNAGLQELVNGTKSPAEVQEQLGEQYQAGVDGHRRLIDDGCRGRGVRAAASAPRPTAGRNHHVRSPRHAGRDPARPRRGSAPADLGVAVPARASSPAPAGTRSGSTSCPASRCWPSSS